MLGCSLVVSGWEARRDCNFTLSPTSHLSVGLVPSSYQRFIDRHFHLECFFHLTLKKSSQELSQIEFEYHGEKLAG